MMLSAIHLINLTPTFFIPRDVSGSEVWGCDVRFERGGSYCIEAASGCGKSSLLNFISMFRSDYAGSVMYDITDIKSLSADAVIDYRQCGIAYMFQDMRLFPSLTVHENVEIVNRIKSFRTERQIESMLTRLGIDDKSETPAARLSLGQQQRVAFVRSLCQPCDFILLDEPISHLDDDNAKIMAEMLSEEQEQCGVGIIATSVGRALPLNYNKILRL